jgi:Cu/Ag efflux protein CusF
MMIKPKLPILTFILMSAIGCQGPGTEADQDPVESATGVYSSIGLVTKIDEEGGKITIDHDEIKNLMPAMEMEFEATAGGPVGKELIGQLITFDLSKTDDVYRVSKISAISGSSPKEKYLENCARCHGEFGEGRVKGIPFIEGHALAHSEEDFIKTVTNGKKRMPSFRDELSDTEIKWIVKYVRKIIQQGKTDTQKHEH